jgi:predicted nucleic acid-binding protein
MKVLVDSSVWIDLFADRDTLETQTLSRITSEGESTIVVGDLILTEVLQGTRDRTDFNRKLSRLSLFDQITIVDHSVAVQAALNYQLLRTRGITIRKTIDTLIATRCILDGMPLLHSGRDFNPFVAHLGLRSAIDGTGVN